MFEKMLKFGAIIIVSWFGFTMVFYGVVLTFVTFGWCPWNEQNMNLWIASQVFGMTGPVFAIEKLFFDTPSNQLTATED